MARRGADRRPPGNAARAGDLLAEGRDPSTIRNALMPLRVIFRRAVEDGDVAVNPCTHLRFQRSAAGANESRRPRRPSGCSLRFPNSIGRSGRPRFAQTSVAAS
jgi:hypothetical protein